jgi:hypothetical protein
MVRRDRGSLARSSRVLAFRRAASLKALGPRSGLSIFQDGHRIDLTKDQITALRAMPIRTTFPRYRANDLRIDDYFGIPRRDCDP